MSYYVIRNGKKVSVGGNSSTRNLPKGSPQNRYNPPTSSTKNSYNRYKPTARQQQGSNETNRKKYEDLRSMRAPRRQPAEGETNYKKIPTLYRGNRPIVSPDRPMKTWDTAEFMKKERASMETKTQLFTMKNTSRRENLVIAFFSPEMFEEVGLNPRMVFGEEWDGNFGCMPVRLSDLNTLVPMLHQSRSCSQITESEFMYTLTGQCSHCGIVYETDEATFADERAMGGPGGTERRLPQGDNYGGFTPEFTGFGQDHILGHPDELDSRFDFKPHSPESQSFWNTFFEPSDTAKRIFDRFL